MILYGREKGVFCVVPKAKTKEGKLQRKTFYLSINKCFFLKGYYYCCCCYYYGKIHIK